MWIKFYKSHWKIDNIPEKGTMKQIQSFSEFNQSRDIRTGWRKV